MTGVPAVKGETEEVKRIRVMIVDDSAAVRDGLRSILNSHADFNIIAEAVDGLDAIAKAKALHPDVILMDAQIPGTDGAEAARCIKKCLPEIRVLFLAVHVSDIQQALAAGVDGYLMKDCPREELLKAIRDMARGMP